VADTIEAVPKPIDSQQLFPVIAGAVRWYLRFDLSYRDIEELLVERGVELDTARMFFRPALSTLKVKPTDVVTDAATVYPAVLDARPALGLSPLRSPNSPKRSDRGPDTSSTRPPAPQRNGAARAPRQSFGFASGGCGGNYQSRATSEGDRRSSRT
jgi:hypothetical protein